MLAGRSTLPEFLIEERRALRAAGDELDVVVLNVALACKAIARRVASGALGDAAPGTARAESQKQLEALSNQLFVRSNERAGLLAGMLSADVERPHEIPGPHPKGPYLLLFDAVDGLPHVDVNVPVGSIFSILRAAEPGAAAAAGDFLRPGCEQICAGYAMYGPSTVLVLTLGSGVHGFTLDPWLGEFILTHPSLEIPAVTDEFAINASRSRFWEPAVKRYVDECLAGSSGPRGRDFQLRWIASLVSEVHRILLRGGIGLYPRDTQEPNMRSRLRLLYECNPVAFLVEQAGGLATTGHQRALDVVPAGLDERSGLIFGSREEVERIERYHREHNLREYDAPLFGSRGLFRTPS